MKTEEHISSTLFEDSEIKFGIIQTLHFSGGIPFKNHPVSTGKLYQMSIYEAKHATKFFKNKVYALTIDLLDWDLARLTEKGVVMVSIDKKKKIHYVEWLKHMYLYEAAKRAFKADRAALTKYNEVDLYLEEEGLFIKEEHLVCRMMHKVDFLW